jgi:hypothetical protein
MFKFSHISPIPSLRTGGLIPIMLGRLQMTVDACIEAYILLSGKVFQKSSHWVNLKGRLQDRFDKAELEKLIKQILVDQGLDENVLLKNSPEVSCKVYAPVDTSLYALLIK